MSESEYFLPLAVDLHKKFTSKKISRICYTYLCAQNFAGDKVGIGRYLLKLLKSNWKKSIVLRYVSSDCLQIKPSLKCK